MKCEKSFKQVLIKYWGMTELGRGQSYDQVKEGMKKLNRLTIPEIKEIRIAQREGK
jgi:CO dehydrogenase/acetyl-CoA synthase gamma subunit (corrinoid Fe-S protein)